MDGGPQNSEFGLFPGHDALPLLAEHPAASFRVHSEHTGALHLLASHALLLPEVLPEERHNDKAPV